MQLRLKTESVNESHGGVYPHRLSHSLGVN
jgi:hypothetical protein